MRKQYLVFNEYGCMYDWRLAISFAPGKFLTHIPSALVAYPDKHERDIRKRILPRFKKGIFLGIILKLKIIL